MLHLGRNEAAAGKQCSIGLQHVSELNVPIPPESWTGLSGEIPQRSRREIFVPKALAV